MGSEGLKKTAIVSSGIELFCTKDSMLAIAPSVFKILKVEKSLELGRNVFKKSEYSSFRMFVTENIENKAFFRHESISIFRIPLGETRYKAPR
jgi:hypothetical protein